LAASQTAPHRQVMRARVLLSAGQGIANARIAEQVGVSVDGPVVAGTVRRQGSGKVGRWARFAAFQLVSSSVTGLSGRFA